MNRNESRGTYFAILQTPFIVIHYKKFIKKGFIIQNLMLNFCLYRIYILYYLQDIRFIHVRKRNIYRKRSKRKFLNFHPRSREFFEQLRFNRNKFLLIILDSFVSYLAESLETNYSLVCVAGRLRLPMSTKLISGCVFRNSVSMHDSAWK